MISKLKYTLLTMLLAAFVAQPVLASPLNNDDMAFAFGNSSAVSSDLGEMALLSDQEMKETEGAWLNFAIGGAIGLGSYAYNNWGNMTWGGALGSTALGALGGYGAGVAGLRVLGIYKNTGGFGVSLGRPGIWNPSRWYGNKNQFGRIDFHRNSHDSFIHTHRGGWRPW